MKGLGIYDKIKRYFQKIYAEFSKNYIFAYYFCIIGGVMINAYHVKTLQQFAYILYKKIKCDSEKNDFWKFETKLKKCVFFSIIDGKIIVGIVG